MCQVKIFSVLALAAVMAVLLHDRADARPSRTLSRQKRISDQRLAELETLIALSKMKNKMVTIPVGFGKVDPLKIGRRKRSMDDLLKQLLSDITSKEDREDEAESEESVGEDADLLTRLVYDESQKMARYRHLPVRLPE